MLAENIYSGYLTKQKTHNVFLYLPTIQAIQQFVSISQNQYEHKKIPQIFSFENIETQLQEQVVSQKNHPYHIKQQIKFKTINVISPIKQKLILLKEFNKITEQIYQEVKKQIIKQKSQLKVNEIIPEFTFGKNIRAAQFMVDEFIRFFNQILIDDIPEEHLVQVLEDLLENAEQNLLRYTTIYFIKHMNEYWHKICFEKKYQTGLATKIQAIKKITENLENISENNTIIVAGSNATTNTMREFLTKVAKRKNSAVVLTALDVKTNVKYFHDVEISHPQYYIRNFLQNCAITPQEVVELKSNGKNQQIWQKNRLYLIRQVMQSAKNIQWHQIIKQKNIKQKQEIVRNINLIEAENEHQEIENIIYIVEKILKQKNKTLSIVTADRDMLDKIKKRLETQKINLIDQSSQKISETEQAKLFLLISDCFLPCFSITHFFALIKNSQINAQLAQHNNVLLIENIIRNYNGNCHTLKDIEDILKQQQTIETIEITQIITWIDEIRTVFQPFIDIAKLNHKINIAETLQKHLDIFSEITTENIHEQKSQKIKSILQTIIDESKEMPYISKENYRWFIYDFLAQISINRENKSDVNIKKEKRITISGVWEMRLLHADCIILASLVEGNFPAYHRQSFWFGRDIAEKIGFRDNTYQLGQSAHDFAHLCGKKHIWLTYAKKNKGNFNTPSCFFLRMKTFVNAMTEEKIGEKIEQKIEQKIIKHKKILKKIEILPKPKPEKKYRPQIFSNYCLQQLLHNPYQFYGEKILKLKPLDGLQKTNNQYQYFRSVKDIFNEIAFANKKYKINDLQKIAQNIIDNQLKQLIERKIINQTEYYIWNKKIKMIVENYLDIEKLWQQNILTDNIKPNRYLNISTQNTKFTLKCYVDRFIKTIDGDKYIIEYTNKIPSIKSFKQLEHPKALLYNLAGEKNHQFANVTYLKIKPGKTEQKQYLLQQQEIKELLGQLKQNLTELFSQYENEKTPFLFLQNDETQRYDHYSDYTHLALVQHREILGKT